MLVLPALERDESVGVKRRCLVLIEENETKAECIQITLNHEIAKHCTQFKNTFYPSYPTK